MNVDDLLRELAQGRFHPAYLLLGPEDYERRRATEAILEKGLSEEERAWNLAEFSARSDTIRDILTTARTFPVMARRRIVMVRDVDELPEDAREPLTDYLAEKGSATVLVLSGVQLDRRTTFYRQLSERACTVDLQHLKGPALERWVAERVRGLGHRIAPAAVAKLVDLAGSDLLSLSAEIEKLSLHAAGAKEITEASVDTLVRGSRQHGVFEMINAVARRDRAAALSLLDNLSEFGEPPLLILNLMTRHFRQVLIVQDLLDRGQNPGQAAAAAQVPGFLRQEFVRRARAMDRGRARVLFRQLAAADVRFKSTRTDEWMLLQKLICEL